MADWLATWYVSVIPLLIIVPPSIYATNRMRGVMERLHASVCSPEDLEAVRGEINLNMRIAMLILFVSLVFWGTLAVLYFLRGMPGAFVIGHLLVFSIVQMVVGRRAQQDERKFRAMHVEGADPAIAAKFQRWLAEWRQARFAVSD